MLANINLTDMETCYKAFRREIIQSISIQEKRFGFESKITAKMLRRNLRIYEVGISYYGRTYEEGKKISWKNGFRAIWYILKYNLLATHTDQRPGQKSCLSYPENVVSLQELERRPISSLSIPVHPRA